MESLIRNLIIDLVNVDREVTVSWKQGSAYGIGGDHSQVYHLCKYRKDVECFWVFIQRGFDIPHRLPIDRRLQWGMNDGIFFLVYHDKSQTPYQHRFVQNVFQHMASHGNNILKLKTKGLIDVSSAAGDYLHEINI